MDKSLALLGLALRAGRLEVGEECVGSACKYKKARLVIAAEDAAAGSVRRALLYAQQGQCLCLTVPFSKQELGGAVGRDLCALCAFTDTGLAGAFVGKLAESYPEKFGPAAGRLQLKAKRAKARKASKQEAARGKRKKTAGQKQS
ncbi:MAG: 50S ribosomal protein L7 [Oscillospiraceae bacterium]|nr:50S ribosomal protein L7 [Oscillospiraceae bacterium]